MERSMLPYQQGEFVGIQQLYELAQSNVRTSANLTESVQQIANQLSSLSMSVSNMNSEIDYLKNGVPINGFQKKQIKRGVSKQVRKILGNDYKNASKRAIAYSMAYNSLNSRGYTDSDSTEKRAYESIIERNRFGYKIHNFRRK